MRRILDAIEWPLALALVCGVGLVARAQEVDVDVDAPGATVKVGPDKGAGRDVRVRAPGVRVDVDVDRDVDIQRRTIRVAPEQPAAPAAPSFWIGIVGGDVSPELRLHLGLKEEGVIVQEVVEGGPAQAGGIQAHDILLRANGNPISSMAVLIEEVRLVGPSKGQVTVDLIRAGQPKTLWIKPVERPAPPVVEQPGFREVERGDLLGRIFGGRAGGQLQFRMLGPGVLEGGNVHVHANGVSVGVTTVNGETRVNVKRGNEEWDINANDPQALDQLPDDIRAMVDGVLEGNVNVDVERLLPDLQGLFGRGRVFDARQERLQRMERLERELAELRAAEPQADSGEAPAFDPDAPAAPPAEVEIPAEE